MGRECKLGDDAALSTVEIEVYEFAEGSKRQNLEEGLVGGLGN